MILFWFSKYKSIVKYWIYLFLFKLCTWTSFPGAALPKYHKLVCLKIEFFFFTVEIYCLTILEAKKSNIKVSAGPWSFQTPQRSPSLVLPSFRWFATTPWCSLAWSCSPPPPVSASVVTDTLPGWLSPLVEGHWSYSVRAPPYFAMTSS